MKVKIKKINSKAKMPTYGSNKAAGCDLYACIDNNISAIDIYPHTTVKIGTGISIEPPEGYFGAIFARSGLATNTGLAPANKVGVCDEDYRGEYIVALHNHSEKVATIKHGDRIAQLIFLPYEQAEFIEVNDLTKTERGIGGFGSSGR